MNDRLGAAAFDALLHGTGGAVILLVDQRLRVRRAGRDAAALAGRSPDELVGMSLIAAFGSVALDEVAREALRTGATAVGEADLGDLRSRTFAAEAVPIPAGGLALSLYEITRLRRAERARRDFVANISHELRTPLSSIKLVAQTLSSGAIDDRGAARDFALQIEREVDHLAQLVDELLELSRIESGEVRLAIERLKPGDVLATLAERIGPMAARREIRVRVLPPPDDAGTAVLADPERLGQALLNLAHNGVKYSRPGGELRLGWRASDARVRFEVADDGVGIAAAHQGRIFERFYKADRSRARAEPQLAMGREPDEEDRRPSAGLGLAIVRHIAEAHGGSVGLHSVEGVGSTFWIELPRA